MERSTSNSAPTHCLGLCLLFCIPVLVLTPWGTCCFLLPLEGGAFLHLFSCISSVTASEPPVCSGVSEWRGWKAAAWLPRGEQDVQSCSSEWRCCAGPACELHNLDQQEGLDKLVTVDKQTWLVCKASFCPEVSLWILKMGKRYPGVAAALWCVDFISSAS